MFAALGSFVFRRRWYVLAAGILFMVGERRASAQASFGNLKGGGFNDPDSESTQVLNAIQRQTRPERDRADRPLRGQERRHGGQPRLQERG